MAANSVRKTRRGYKCSRCQDTRVVLVEHVEEASDGSRYYWHTREFCPVCVLGTEEPEWRDLDGVTLVPPPEDDDRPLSERSTEELERLEARTDRKGLRLEVMRELQRRYESVGALSAPGRPADSHERTGRARMFAPVPGGYVAPDGTRIF